MARRRSAGDGSAAATLTVCQSAAQVLYAVYAVEAARRLGIGQFGLVAAGVGLALIVTDLLDFGRTTHMLRAVAGGGNGAYLVGAQLSWRLRSLCSLGCLYLALLALLSPHRLVLLSGLAAYLVLAGMSFTLNAALRARAQFRQAGLSVLVERSAALVVGGALLASSATRTAGYCVGLAAGSAASCCYALSRLPRDWRRLRPQPLTAERTRYAEARHFGVTSVLTDLWMADATVVAAVAGSLQGGLFAAATRFAGPMALIPKNLAAVLLVRSSAMRGRVLSWHDYRRVVIRLVVTLTVLLLPVFLLAPDLLGLIFGPGYRSAAGVLRLYCVASIVVCATEPAMAMLQGRGRAAAVSRAVLVAVGANLVCLLIGSRLDGATGASAGYLTAQVVLLLSLARPVRLLGKPSEGADAGAGAGASAPDQRDQSAWDEGALPCGVPT